MVSVRIFKRVDEKETTWEGLGLKEFLVVPRVGDYISLQAQDNPKVLYKVIAVVHVERIENIEIFIHQMGSTPEKVESMIWVND